MKRSQINHRLHPDVVMKDFPLIESVLASEEKIAMFYERYERALSLIKRKPLDTSVGKPLRRRLGIYRKHKFFSYDPQRGDNPDMRVVYRFDETNQTVLIYGVGFRKNGNPPDIADIYRE